MKKTKMTDEERAYFKWEHENFHAATAVEVVGAYSLHITFDDGTDTTIDFGPALRTIYNKGMYAPLIDPAYFAQVTIDDCGVLTWPNGIDFNPAFVYKWDDHFAMLGIVPPLPESDRVTRLLDDLRTAIIELKLDEDGSIEAPLIFRIDAIESALAQPVLQA